MIRIMFVCHGNICRSPMAEFITKKIVNDLGLAEDYVIASSATSTEELGNTIYPPARRELDRKGVPYDQRKATRLKRSDYESYDHIIVMDSYNLRNISFIIPDDPAMKIRKLLTFAGELEDVFDPWYSGDFDTAFNDIFRGCSAMLCKLDPRITVDKIRRLGIG